MAFLAAGTRSWPQDSERGCMVVVPGRDEVGNVGSDTRDYRKCHAKESGLLLQGLRVIEEFCQERRVSGSAV